MNILLTTGESMERLFNLDWQLLADSCLTLIAVLFLFGALSFFLFNPVRKMLTGRTEKIKGIVANGYSSFSCSMSERIAAFCSRVLVSFGLPFFDKPPM